MKLAVLSPACLLVGLLGQPKATVALRSKALATTEDSAAATALSERHVPYLDVDNNWWHDPAFQDRVCLMLDVDTPTTILKSDTVVDYPACRVWCKKEPECNHWTFNYDMRRCFLKKGPLVTTARKGYISESGDCDNSAMTNFDRGSTTGNFWEGHADFALQCREKCEGDHRCSHYTWNRNTRKCYLKSGHANLKVVHGDETSVPCVWYNIGSRTPDEKVHHNIDNVYKCVDLCRGFPYCTHATWNVNTKNCHLKRGVPQTYSYNGDMTIRNTCMRQL